MIRETIKIKLTKEYKQEAMDLIDDTIDRVSDKFKFCLSEKDRRKIKNLSLDQVNINISQKNNSKTLWIFDTEEYIPIIVEKEEGLPKMGLLFQNESNVGCYKMKPNLTWTFNKANCKKCGVTHEEFEGEVLKMLLEDFETASFYGTLSYITESDKYEKR